MGAGSMGPFDWWFLPGGRVGILSLKGHLEMPEEFSGATTGEGCSWFLVSRGEGCC